MLHAALLAGLFIGVLSALPIVNIANCCCFWILSGGALATYVLQQNEPDGLSAGRSAAVGALAGVAGAVTWLVLSVALDALFSPLQQRMIATMSQNAADMPPDVRAWFESLADSAASPARFAVGFFFQLMAGAIFAPIGAVVAFAFLAPKSSGHIDERQQPPPLP